MVVLVVVLFVSLAWLGLGAGEESGAQGGPEMTGAEFEALPIGASRDEIEDAVGRGDSALEFQFLGGTGTAVEPMDATCVYYAFAGARSLGGRLAQLCYRSDELASKSTFRA